MRVVIQVSGKANCTVDHKPYSEIPRGLFVLVGFTEGDNEDKIKWMVNKIVNMRIFPKDEERKPVPKNLKIDDKDLDADIIVSGIDKVRVNLAHCCYPVYGDEIIGYITRGNGISVHRINCHNLEEMDDRTVDVKWNSNVNKKYLSYLLIYSNSRENHMMEIVQAISQMSISIEEVKVINKDANFIYEISIYVQGVEQLNKIINILNNNQYIENVERSLR